MKTQISYHNLESASHESIDNAIGELARRHLERYLSRFPADTVSLHVHLEKSRHRNYYRVSMHLSVPGTTLAASEEDNDLMMALRESFDELERELLRHISRLRQEDSWRRKERRDELRRLKKALDTTPGTGTTQAFAALVRALLPQLHNYGRRELSALRARGDLNPGYPTPQDIVDDVLARAYQRFGARPADLEPLHWLYQLTHEVLKDDVRKSWREEGRFISAESKPPRPRDYTLDERDQGVYEFWQPDELPKIGDVAPVTGTPEERVGEAELRRYLHDAQARMPNNWRRAMWLAQAEKMPLPKVARMLGASDAEVKRWIQQGDEYLRARLIEAGYRPAEEGKLSVWFVPTPANATPELAEALEALMKGAI